ncbi:hypothetical protein JCM33374_g2814 [Metschnikowia sp. JCM 33374]|nr:hypothetical protein JCM33374_g2814 [Metschnikowia sp. JCM 33374]
MPNLQLKGPRSAETGPVRYQTVFSRSQGQDAAGLLVTIDLGEKLRHCVDHTLNGKKIDRQPNSQKQSSSSNMHNNAYSSPSSHFSRANQTSNTTRETSTINTSGNGKYTAASDWDKDSDLGSDLEITEIRSIVPTDGRTSVRENPNPKKRNIDATDYDSSDDLSSLDTEITHALTSAATIPTQMEICPPLGRKIESRTKKPSPPIHKLLPDFYKPHVVSNDPPPPGYRNIPPNLVYAIHRELNMSSDSSTDDDIEVMEKLVFSLKDPIVKTKIKLPIKSTTCRHFECFDFQTFCEFYGLNPNSDDETSLKTVLLQQSRQARKNEDLFLKQQQKLRIGTLKHNAPGIVYPHFSQHGQMFFTELYGRTAPLYKCPLCDEKFGLKQLYISDIFNFFVKTTPRHITKVQLEGSRFKIVEEANMEQKEEEAEIVDLSSEEEEREDHDSKNKHRNGGAVSVTSKAGQQKSSETSFGKANRSLTADDFNDGLDDVLINISQGDGSWRHPVTLD